MTDIGVLRTRCGQRVRGQAMLETLIALPVVVLTILLFLQLVWLGLASATLQTAVNFSVRAGTIEHGKREVMERTLVAGMASIVPHHLTNLPPTTAELWQAQVGAVTEQWVHFKWAAQLKVHSPTAEIVRTSGEQRYDLELGRMVTELAVDHPKLRSAATADKGVQWQAERMLDVEVWWCWPLEVPLAGRLLSELRSRFGTPAQGFCQRRQQLNGQPLWALQHRVAYPMLSGYRQAN